MRPLIFLAVVFVSISSTATEAASWKMRVEKSALTDEEGIFLSLESDGPINCRYGNDTHATLHIRCMENTTSLMIVAPSCHLASSRYNNYGDVTYRIDKEKAVTKGFVESTDNKALGLWSGRKSIPLIKSLIGKSKLITRFTPFSGSPVTPAFNISGLDGLIGRVRKACHW